MSASTAALRVEAAGIQFRNPILLAAGTAGYGRELEDVVDLHALGGIITKAVSPEPRAGAPAPRVAEFEGGMINAVGLANPGLDAVRRDHLPWLRERLGDTRAIMNVVGSSIDDFGTVVAGIEAALAEGAGSRNGRGEGVHAFELNVSCPNVRAGGVEFGANPATLAEVVRVARAASRRPLFVKLSPTLPDIAAAARTAVDAGADGITVVNTLPGLVIDPEHRRPVLGFGSGGVSGPGLLPVGVLATYKVARAVPVPVIGVGGVASAADALQYIMAGATLVAIGTAALREPRAPEKIVHDLAHWCARHGVSSLASLVGAVEWK